MAYTYLQRIGGEWLPAANAKSKNLLNPATEEPLRAQPFGDGADCRLAIEAASKAFPAWSKRTAYERAAVLKRAADLIRERLADLARTTVLESGKPFLQSKGEWGAGADLFEWFAEEGKRAYGRVIPSKNPARRLIVLRQPLGVIGIITAWNFPIYNIARAAAAALAAGCTIVIRPSEYTSMTAMELVNILVEAGISDGVVNLVNGQSSSIGQEMLDNPLCAKIHFTGSPRVGRILMDGASKTITRLSLELGGNAPVLIFPDVDLDQRGDGQVPQRRSGVHFSAALHCASIDCCRFLGARRRACRQTEDRRWAGRINQHRPAHQREAERPYRRNCARQRRGWRENSDWRTQTRRAATWIFL